MTYQNLKALRERLSMTQKDFAASLGIGQTTYNGYETGAREPKSDFWISVARKYGVTIDYLMGYSDNPKETSETKIVRFPQRDEADEVADIYRKLDDHGKGAVRAILHFEDASRVATEKQSGKKKLQPRSDGFVDVKVFDQVSAAGLGNYLDDPAFHMEQYPANEVPEGTEFGVRISGVSMSPTIPDGATAFVQSRSTIEPGKIGIFLLNEESFCKKLVVDRYRREVRLVSLNPDYKDRIIEDADVFSTMGLVLGWWPHG